jgi:hypothetical protein
MADGDPMDVVAEETPQVEAPEGAPENAPEAAIEQNADLDSHIKSMLGLDGDGDDEKAKPEEAPAPEITLDYDGKTYKTGDTVTVGRDTFTLGKDADARQFKAILSSERQVAATKSAHDTIENRLRKMEQAMTQRAAQPQQPQQQAQQQIHPSLVYDADKDPAYQSFVSENGTESGKALLAVVEKLATKRVGELMLEYDTYRVKPLLERVERDVMPMAEQNALAAEIRDRAVAFEQTFADTTNQSIPDYLRDLKAPDVAEALVALRQNIAGFADFPVGAQNMILSQYLNDTYRPTATVQPVPQAPSGSRRTSATARTPLSPRTAGAAPQRPITRQSSDAELLGL